MEIIFKPFREKKAKAASFYLIVFILILGNWGALYEYYQYYKSPADERNLSDYITAIIHFSPTIIFVSLARLLMKPSSSFRVMVLVALTIASCFIPFWLLEEIPSDAREMSGYIFMGFAAILWWAAFATDQEFAPTAPDASSGGDVSKELNGDVDGFTR